MSTKLPDFLRSKFQNWYAEEICSQLQGEAERKAVDLGLSVGKPLGARWMVSVYDYLKAKPDIYAMVLRKLEL